MNHKNDESISFIVLTSDEPWSEIWHTQLHYAYQLSKRTEVIFLGPPNPWSIKNLFRFKQTSRKVSDHLTVVDYLNFIPAALGGISLWLNDKLNQLLLKRSYLGPLSNKSGIVWHFDPHRSYYIFRDKPLVKHLFHVIDPIAGCNLDVKLSENSDLIVVTSPRFTEYYEKLNSNVIQIGQGVDLTFYKEPDKGSSEETTITKDSILLLGTISDQLHYNILIDIAQEFKGKLVLIGPDKTISERGKEQFKKLLNVEGVRWLGAMPPIDFRKHLRACRVGIIAYDNSVNYKNDFRSPLKVISYLGCGKCIISNIDCEIESLVDKSIFNVTTRDEYFSLLRKSYNDQLVFDGGSVSEFLESINYDNLLALIFSKLGVDIPPVR